MRRELKRLKTYLGRVFRDVCRKIDGHLDLAARFSELLGLVERLLAQKPDDSNKLYALLAAAGHNLRLVLTRLERLVARFISTVAGLMTKIRQMSIAAKPKPVFSNIALRSSGHTTSMA